MLPKNWVCLLVGVEPKDISKPKFGRGKDLLLAASMEDTRDLFQSSVSPRAKLGKFEAKGMCIFMKGLGRV